MNDLFDGMSEESRGRLVARGWRRTPFARALGQLPWEAPDGSRYSDEEAAAWLARREREEASHGRD